MYIDTHCHFDALEFDHDRQEIYEQIEKNNIYLFCMSVEVLNFDKVIHLAQLKNIYFALGIHPLYSQNCTIKDIEILDEYIEKYKNHPKFLGIGEIGLDGICNIDFEQQIFVYENQIKLAKKYNLPVFLHVRKAQDKVLKYLRQYNIQKGIAHAFNGSIQQAQNFIQQGLLLGFGGNITYQRALNIKRLATEIDLKYIALETDAPDMPPEWDFKQRNNPINIIKIYEQIGVLKNIDLEKTKGYVQHNLFEYFNIPNQSTTITKSNWPII